MRHSVTFLVCAVLAALPVVPVGAGPVEANIVAEVGAAPGSTSRIGVRFELAPDWHIYWLNPGDAGLATEVEWFAPESVVIGDLQWPTPVEFDSPGGIRSFGYAGTVTLASKVEWPAWSVEGSIEARISWLACKEKCILGDAEISVPLPLPAAGIDPEVFRGFDQTLPKPLPKTGAPFSVRVDRGAMLPRVWLAWARPPAAVRVFPSVGGDHRVWVRTETRAGLTRIDLESIGDVPSSIPLVLAVGDGVGMESYRIDLKTNESGGLAGVEEE